MFLNHQAHPLIVSIRNVTKSLLYKEILKDISFDINLGEVVGIVGPNGAGKTTLFNILTGSLKADSGNVVFSKGIKLDYVITRNEFFDDMSVGDNLKLRCHLSKRDISGIENNKNIFKINYFDKLFYSLSAGMKQKVALTASFLGHSDLILLDEPTNHLDIDSIIILRDTVVQLKERGVSFLVASHSFSELEKICDRVIFIKSGKILLDEKSTELLLKFADFENAYKSIMIVSKA